MNDRDYMALALKLAKRGLGWTSPNPLVGAVIVKEGRIIGQGYHTRCGGLHAEREALNTCMENPEGATLYVTLEPCCHQGRQPPCTEAILQTHIRRVVVGSTDPNPLVAGKGIDNLRNCGVEVETGVLRKECDALNRVFFHYIQSGRPYVVMKYAMTLDGRIATRTGASQWITGDAARTRVHQDRSRYRSIMAGVGTVLADAHLPDGTWSEPRPHRLRYPAEDTDGQPDRPFCRRSPHRPGGWQCAAGEDRTVSGSGLSGVDFAGDRRPYRPFRPDGASGGRGN